MVGERQRNPCCWHVLMMMILIHNWSGFSFVFFFNNSSCIFFPDLHSSDFFYSFVFLFHWPQNWNQSSVASNGNQLTELPPHAWLAYIHVHTHTHTHTHLKMGLNSVLWAGLNNQQTKQQNFKATLPSWAILFLLLLYAWLFAVFKCYKMAPCHQR